MDQPANAPLSMLAADSDEHAPSDKDVRAFRGYILLQSAEIAICAPERSSLDMLIRKAEPIQTLMVRSHGANCAAELPDSLKVLIVETGVLTTPAQEFVRDMRVASTIGIIFVAQQSTSRDRIMALESGADEFLCPSPDLDELLARARALVRRVGPGAPRSGASTQFEFDGWRLDRVARMIVSPEGTPVQLTAREFDALTLLLETANRPVERARFNVADLQVDSRAPDALVGRLRRKLLAAGADKRLIRPVRSVGYILTADVRRL